MGSRGHIARLDLELLYCITLSLITLREAATLDLVTVRQVVLVGLLNFHKRTPRRAAHLMPLTFSSKKIAARDARKELVSHARALCPARELVAYRDKPAALPIRTRACLRLLSGRS